MNWCVGIDEIGQAFVGSTSKSEGLQAGITAGSTRPPGNSHKSGSTALALRWVIR